MSASVILVDTGPLVALAGADDDDHERSRSGEVFCGDASNAQDLWVGPAGRTLPMIV